jgi:hypothetical protein
MEESKNNFSCPKELMRTKTQEEVLVADGDYSRIANFRTKIDAIFGGMLGIFSVFQNLCYIYSMISLETTNCVLRNAREPCERILHPSPGSFLGSMKGV